MSLNDADPGIEPVVRERPPTVYDVAELAGVSAQTVSRMLARQSAVRPATRARVEEAIATLGYRPNRMARVLRTGKSRRIGVVAHQMFEYGPARLIVGADSRAREAGYTLTIIGTDAPAGSEARATVDDAFDTFRSERVEGIVAVTLTDSVRAEVERVAVEVPMIVDPAESADTAESISHRGAALVARHLAELGHRNCGVVGAPGTWVAARHRREGFERALNRAGGIVAKVWPGDWTAAAGARAAAAFDPADGITAVFALSDAQAIGFMYGLESRGIRVPRDVSVVGFDDIPVAGFLNPGLTTVCPDYETQGRLAVDRLLARLEGRAEPALAPDGLRLVQRGSTGRPS